ncbi:MAG TPA: DUF1330 domain-containing protein [Devosia sp.]|nr:DUF1330 domain-containing protein [Devosia sp.]
MKSYWVVFVDVSDPDAYKSLYQAANAAPIRKHGGRFLVRGMDHTVVEGSARSRLVVIEFPTETAARDCYYSAEYQAAKSLRDDLAISDFVIAEGYGGPQPSDAA